jgi:hypothetical protein
MKSFMKNVLPFLCLSLILIPSISSAAVYFADNRLTSNCSTGNYSIATRSCNGSDGKAYKTIQEAITTANASGDTVYVRSGVYNERVLLQYSGGINNYLTISAYNGEQPIISPGSGSTGIDLNRKNWIRILGITFDGGRSGIRNNSASGDIPSSNIWIENCIFQNQVYLSEPDGSISLRPWYLNVKGCTFRNSSGTAGRQIILWPCNRSGYDWFMHVVIENNNFLDQTAQDSIHIGAGRDVTIRSNYFNGQSGQGGHSDAIALESSGDVVIDNNIFNHASNFDFDCQTCPAGGTWCLWNVKVTNNIINDIAGHSIHHKKGWLIAKNNTFSGALYASIKTENSTAGSCNNGQATRATILNNVFHKSGENNQILQTSSNIINFNTYYQISGTLVQNGDSGVNSAIRDPKFLNPGNPIGIDGVWRTVDDGLNLRSDSLDLDRGGYLNGFISNKNPGLPRIISIN